MGTSRGTGMSGEKYEGGANELEESRKNIT